MNWDRIEGYWKRVAGKVKDSVKLKQDDITVIGGMQIGFR